jgi:hypothetical protein
LGNGIADYGETGEAVSLFEGIGSVGMAIGGGVQLLRARRAEARARVQATADGPPLAPTLTDQITRVVAQFP